MDPGPHVLSWVDGKPVQVKVVSEVAHDSLGLHAERGHDELGVHRVDQVRQEGAVQGPRRDAAAVGEMAHISGQGWRSPWPWGLGDPSRAGWLCPGTRGGRGSAAGPASLPGPAAQHGDGCRARPFSPLIDVVGAQVPGLVAGASAESGPGPWPFNPCSAALDQAIL